jgi:hypothetical protein
MKDPMLYIMVAALLGMFGWAGVEYAKAGYEFWKEQRRAADDVAPKRDDVGQQPADIEVAAQRQDQSATQTAAQPPVECSQSAQTSEQKSEPPAPV